MGRVVTFLMVVLFWMLVSAPQPSVADEGVGEWVREAAPRGPDVKVAPGHFGLMAKNAQRFLTTGPGPHRTIYAEGLMDGVDDPDMADEITDFFVLDIRSKAKNGRRDADYCAGHIPGAVWIPFEDVADPENLAVLPVDLPILVVCYTGHTASQINAILNLLGLDAWTLRFGMTAWKDRSLTTIFSPDVAEWITGGSYDTEVCQ